MTPMESEFVTLLLRSHEEGAMAITTIYSTKGDR